MHFSLNFHYLLQSIQLMKLCTVTYMGICEAVFHFSPILNISHDFMGPFTLYNL